MTAARAKPLVVVQSEPVLSEVGWFVHLVVEDPAGCAHRRVVGPLPSELEAVGAAILAVYLDAVKFQLA
jgi:hypothetical protein